VSAEPAFPPFSAEARREHWTALAGETWDLLVVGGGITGAGIARDAAGRGLRVALVDSGDIGRGTSSRSSRLVHGGIRYLETGDLRLVFEASAERRRLLSLAPHLVHPQEFLFPVFRGGPVDFRKLQAGMWLYDLLSLFRNIRPHRMLGRAAVAEAEPGLRRDTVRGAALYYDAAVDDARLTLANARGAHESGAAVVSYGEVFEFIEEDGAMRGARVRDRLTGATVEVRARVVVNAAGPWSDAVRRLADPSAQPRLRPTKGVHIMVPHARLANRHAITFPSPVDGRVMFVLPWGDFSYVGTTDTDFEGDPADVAATDDDVRYLLDSANGIFPDAKLTAADVVSTWAGIRPLLAPATKGSGLAASATSREHEIWRDPSGLLNIAGGKLTTYRVMAKQATDAAARILRAEGVTVSSWSLTADLPLPGAPLGDYAAFEARIRREAAELGMGDDVGLHLARARGEDADALLEEVRADSSLGARLVEGRHYIWAEVPHSVRAEMAITLSDVLIRRLHLFYEAEDGGLSVAPAVAEMMATQPGIRWDAAEVARQVDAYRAEVQATRGFGGTAA
jgi:glycerol-3-phosphate dehydrogenase